MPDELKKPQLRAIQYYYVDGAFEFGMGGLCLLLAAYFYFQNVLRDTALGEMLITLFILIVIGGGWLINRLVRWLKERITFPRTGYVSYRRDQEQKRGVRIAVGGGVGMLISALVGWMVIHRPAALDWMPLLTGLLFGFVIALFAWRTQLARFYVLAVISLALGIALSVLGLEEWSGVTVYYGAMSLVLLFTGACVLRTYLRHNPAPQEPPDVR